MWSTSRRRSKSRSNSSTPTTEILNASCAARAFGGLTVTTVLRMALADTNNTDVATYVAEAFYAAVLDGAFVSANLRARGLS